ncbi:hypothetical protein BBJ66_05415 [Rhizobium sp. RSm-3]|uniref:hypothetical protein n=1 Tax=unclassified Rhizobium TaxID=2613769 RepID=UPI00090ED346|nr:MULTISPECIES: hypothetical protein [unclassified Rhizobium]OHV26159.1 hypothetical protein BBJ66_05415 [Rhizobium sp. RSm-3]
MPEKNLGVRAGDAIIFDVRIEHAGQMPTLVDRSLPRIFDRVLAAASPGRSKGLHFDAIDHPTDQQGARPRRGFHDLWSV